jgi:hypothetical protein
MRNCNVILPIVLHGSKTYSLTFREQHIVQEWGEEDTRKSQDNGDNCSLGSFMLSVPCDTYGGRGDAFGVLVWKPERQL